MTVYIFGNGNLSFNDYLKYYKGKIDYLLANKQTQFILCDFRGVDTLTMEVLKCETTQVSIYHIGEMPRYIPDKYKTKVSPWKFIGGFESDDKRDKAAINNCTHFLAIDVNSNQNRVSSTLRNIDYCNKKGKINIMKN